MEGILFMVFLLAIVIGKQIIGIVNSQMYVREYKRMVNGQQSGRFGVGVYRPKMGVGEVCFIIIDDGRIKQCKILRGLSIFAKFRDYETVLETKVSDEKLLNDRHSKSIQAAIQHACAAGR
ncbi:hypothetical protein AUQ39_10415 [Lacticaseibacillus casei]|uniref:transcriptional regulator GutM n=1 Tax=Lacticaseibacillus TaxID=2759736 RepID=UPI00024933CA|nr:MULTISPECIES: transcriptional regulator GutM [Lacticaseibacillus]KLI74659.1 hypothetical protein AAW28_13665 [Lacticaseibacillus casei]OLS06276.1 hypothetical protein AUQ39_10415 [Lacticaseibacillus casei]